MITSETVVRELQQSQPLPSFRLRAPKTNPFVPSFPASVSGRGRNIQFTWKLEGSTASAEDQSGKLSDMVERLRRDAGRFPGSAVVRVNLAIALSNQGNLEDAEKELFAAVELEPKNYLASINLAHLLARRGKFDDAMRLYGELLAARPNDNSVLVSLAVIALRNNMLPEAEEKLKLAIANKKGDAAIHFLLGVVQLAMNNLRGAVSELRTASRIDVRNPTIHQALGVIFAVRSEFDRAEQEFRTALMLAPNDRASIRALCHVLLKQAKAGEAVDLLKSFVDRNPGDFAAREGLALGLIDLKQFSTARFHLDRLRAELSDGSANDQLARIQANLGLSWFREGKIDSARTAFNRAIETYPRVSPIAYENLARLYLSQDNIEAAMGILVQSKAVFPERPTTAVLLSHVYSLLGEIEKAIAGLEAFRNRDDAPVEVYVYLSFFYTLKNDPEASIKAAVEGLKKFPQSPMLLNNLAYVYAMTNQLDEARATMKMIPKDVTPHVELIATKGLLRLREGDEKRGVELYEEAEQLASSAGNRELSRRVRQKKHLELARHLVLRSALERARLEVKQGLAIHVKHFSYEDDLLRLSEDIRSRLSS